MSGELDSIGPLLWLLGPAAGIGFYVLTFLRYRNANKRHAYERETASDVHNLRTHDAVVNRVRGTRSSRISGANHSNPRARLGRGTTVTVVPAPSVTSVIDEQMQQAQETQQAQTQGQQGQQAHQPTEPQPNQALPNQVLPNQAQPNQAQPDQQHPFPPQSH